MAAVCECLLCRSSLERAINQRRKLHSDSTKHALTTLREFVGELETSAIEILFYPEAFLSRPYRRCRSLLQLASSTRIASNVSGHVTNT